MKVLWRFFSVVIVVIPSIVSCRERQVIGRDQSGNGKIEKPVSKDDESELETLKDCLNRLGLDLHDAIYLDEPPGKLARLRFEIFSGDRIVISLKHDITLFSEKRNWSDEAVLSARVKGVTQESHN
jgi:hypothetical protein